MRVLIIAAAVLAVSGPVLAQTQMPRLTGSPTSIMAGEPSAKLTPKQRRQARRALDRRQRLEARRTRPSIEVRSPSTGGGQLRSSINSSIQSQQQQLRSSQQNQFETNQIRQDIQRSTIAPIGTGSPGCPAGSVGCWSSPGCPAGSIGC